MSGKNIFCPVLKKVILKYGMKHKCPVCHKTIKTSPQEKAEKAERAKFFPFCSQRCKLMDLGAWLDAKYKIVSELKSGWESDESPDAPSDGQ